MSRTPDPALRVLGPVEIIVDGHRINVGKRRERLLLGVLLLEAGRPIHVDQLIRVSWYGSDAPPTARNGIQVSISRLRGALGRSVPIITAGDTYRADVDPDLIDIHRFRTLVNTARTQSAEAAATILRHATALWRGPFLAGTLDEDARDALYRGLNEERLSAIEQRVDRELELGLHQRLVGELTGLFQDHPTRERLAAHLMLALYRDGQAQRSLDVYRQTRDALADELGLDPSPMLADLEVAILRHDPNLLGTPPSPAAAQLPLTVRGFTGRHTELKWLNDLLAAADANPMAVSLFVISGMAGVGKTTLALRWAHWIADAYPDGQLYVDLRGHSDREQVRPVEALATVLQTLGVRPEQIPTDPAAAAALYRSRLAGRRMLIMLDNARSADQVRSLLPGDHRCAVVITSRYRLADLEIHEGAMYMHLEPLRPAEAEQLLAGLLGNAASVELDAISDIARLCAYLPLALRIAAARLAEQPERNVIWLRDELGGDDRLGALEMQGVSGIAVRAAFDLSYRRLPAETQRLFVLLGLIPGNDFSVEGVAALADLPVPATRRGLAALATAHLIRARSDGRYDFHDLIREYAQTLAADCDERDAAYDRLYAWMCACVEATAQRLYPSIVRLPQWIPQGSSIEINLDLSDNDHATKWLDHELTGLFAAIRDGERNRQGNAVIHLASALRGHLIGHATLPEWLAIGDAALSAASQAGDLRAEAAAQINIAVAHASRDDYPRAIEHLETARFLSERSGWLAGELTSSGNLGKIYWRIGEIASAHAAYRRVIQTSHTQGLPVVTATMIANIAEMLVYMDRPVESLERTAEAIEPFSTSFALVFDGL